MNLLVLCHGNINRSPAVAAMLVDEGWLPAQVRSRGLKAKDGARATLKMREAMEDRGLDISHHRAKQVTVDDFAWADHVIYMDGGNLTRICSFLSTSHNNRGLTDILINLGEYDYPEPSKRIKDPNYMRRGSQEFNDVVSQMAACTQRLVSILMARVEKEQEETYGY